MRDFKAIPGFEELWRPDAAGRRVWPETLVQRSDMAPRARLERIAAGAPEVIVKVTGRPRGSVLVRDHIDYISRNGELSLEDQDGHWLREREAMRKTADEWVALAALDGRRRADTPTIIAFVLSMPRGTEPSAVQDAARTFARSAFGGRFDYLMALHSDADHPHVHFSVRRFGYYGERLCPKRADLAGWRQLFAGALRDRGVAAEASPRWTRGVVRKSEPTAIRKMGDLHREGKGPIARVLREAYREAALSALGQDEDNARPWETDMQERQAHLRGLYLGHAAFLARSSDKEDQALAALMREFVAEMPPIESRREALAREIRQSLTRNPEAEKLLDKDRLK